MSICKLYYEGFYFPVNLFILPVFGFEDDFCLSNVVTRL